MPNRCDGDGGPSGKIAPISKKSLSPHGAEDRKKLAPEANRAWEFPCEDGEAVIQRETVLYGRRGASSAEVGLAKGGNGLWMYSHSATLPNQGYAVPLSVFTAAAFTDRDGALEAGRAAVQGHLQKVINGNSSKTDRKGAAKLCLEMEKAKQFTLF